MKYIFLLKKVNRKKNHLLNIYNKIKNKNLKLNTQWLIY